MQAGIRRMGESPVFVELFHNGMNFVCMCTRCCNTNHCFHSLLLSFVVYCLHYHSSVFPFLDEKPAVSVTERGFLTGDKSVFDLISPQDRARLKRVKEGKTFPIDSESLPNTASQQNLWYHIPKCIIIYSAHKPYGTKHSQEEDHDHKDSKLSTIGSRPVSSGKALSLWTVTIHTYTVQCTRLIQLVSSHSIF